MGTIIDLFAGIGGFHLAFQNLGYETVFASEKDKYARLTYESNYANDAPEMFSSGNYNTDITTIDPHLIPDFDIICAGFPCQPFSNAGLRAGFEDTRGTLFFNVAQIIDVKRPKAFFLENVRGLLSHDNGNTIKVIRTTLERLGYTFHMKVVKASDFNVPQHRPRVFIAGFRNDIVDTFSFPEPLPLTNTLSNVMGGKATFLNGEERKIGFTLRVGGRNSGVHDRRNWDSYIVNGKEHRMTLIEGLKMQGFPENFVFPVSETQAFKQLGNSVAVPAIQATAQEMIRVLS